jgi:hypothetical protein
MRTLLPFFVGSMTILLLGVAAPDSCGPTAQHGNPGDPKPGKHCPDWNPLRNPYVGDTHIHTSNSFDAVLLGVENGPEEAYAFAKGAPIDLNPTGPDGSGFPRTTQLARPLDFAAVTDHAEFFGETHLCIVPPLDPSDPAHPYNSPYCVTVRTAAIGNRDITTLAPPGFTLGAFFQMAIPLLSPVPLRNAICGDGDLECTARASLVWWASQEATNAAYERCEFTSLNAWEWTANTRFPDAPSGANLHRNVIFRGESVPAIPYSLFEAPRVEILWDLLRENCIEGDPECDVLTIPHNSNLSSGRMFKPVYSADPVPASPFYADRPMTAEDAAARAAIEPVAEVTQHKGASECRLSMRLDDGSTTLGSDELCEFESYNRVGVLDDPVQDVPVPRLSFVREGLKEGLVQEEALGVNPFKLGMLGSTDTHNATPGNTEETVYGATGHQGLNDYIPANILEVRNGTGIESNGGGLAVVWAHENTREAIFDAIARKEVYGTSGTRPIVRFFGGWNFGPDICAVPEALRRADGNGVPMGGDLPEQPPAFLDKAPAFYVSALMDPGTPSNPGTDLQRIQIIKGWLDESGDAQEAVYEVAGDPDNGASVDVDTCETSGAGFQSLCVEWRDPDFDREQRAFYYARVVENPVCRWNQELCVDTLGNVGDACAAGTVPPDLAQCCSDTVTSPGGHVLDVQKTVQERAWTSPIWFTP